MHAETILYDWLNILSEESVKVIDDLIEPHAKALLYVTVPRATI